MNKEKMKTVSNILIVVAIIIAIIAIVFYYHAYVAYDNANFARSSISYYDTFSGAISAAGSASEYRSRGNGYMAGGVISTILSIGSIVYAIILKKRIKGTSE